MNLRILPGGLLAVAAFLSGCKSPPPVELAPIGPVSGGQVGLFGTTTGTLLVYSQQQQYNFGGIYYYPYSSYWIYTPDGKQVKWVENHRDRMDPQPTAVDLVPDHYVVKALSQTGGPVVAPVQIIGGKLTVVRLDGLPSNDFGGVPTNDLVRLPDGRAAGRRAVPEPPAANPSK